MTFLSLAVSAAALLDPFAAWIGVFWACPVPSWRPVPSSVRLARSQGIARLVQNQS
jgi:hypothetical protein